MQILVVDDQAVIRGPIAAALKGAGHDAVAVADGKAVYPVPFSWRMA